MLSEVGRKDNMDLLAIVIAQLVSNIYFAVSIYPVNIYKVIGKGWLVPTCKLVVQGLTGSSQSINFKNKVNHSQRIKMSKLLSTAGLQE